MGVAVCKQMFMFNLYNLIYFILTSRNKLKELNGTLPRIFGIFCFQKGYKFGNLAFFLLMFLFTGNVCASAYTMKSWQ